MALADRSTVGKCLPIPSALRARRLHDIASRSSSLRCPGTMATGIGKVPAVLPRLETSGPGPSLAVPAASTRMPMSASSSISLTISSAGVALADHAVRRDAGDVLGARRELVERRIGRFRRLGLHDVGDAQPLLVAVAGVDHAQHDQLRLGAAGALGRPIDRAVAFLGVVDDDQIFALVAGLVAAALAAHVARGMAARRSQAVSCRSRDKRGRKSPRCASGARSRRCP